MSKSKCTFISLIGVIIAMAGPLSCSKNKGGDGDNAENSGSIKSWETVVDGNGPEDGPEKGGTISIRLDAWPKSMNYHISGDVYLGMVSYFTHITLLSSDEEDLHTQPYLATSWSVGKDRKTYTFKLDPDAHWPDGSPITAEDVKWNFDTFWDVKACALCEPIRSFYGPIKQVTVLDPVTVEIKTDRIHFDDLSRLGSLYLVPKAKFLVGSYDKDHDKSLYGGGPYVLDSKESVFRKKVVLKRRKRWWANKHPHIRKSFNFDKIVMKQVSDAAVAHEMFKRKEFDIFYYELDTLSYWDDKSKSPFTEADVGVINAEMFNPSRWGGIALNMRKGPFKEKKFRKALQYLMNRDLMMNKIFKGHVKAVVGPFMPGTKYADWKGRVVTPFDPKKAETLLQEAGFTQTDSNGVRYREVDEDGKKVKQLARVEIMYSLDTHAQWLTVYQEDAKKMGVEIVPRLVEWSAAISKLDEFKFDAFVIGWAGSPTPGPEQLFHGRTAQNKGSSNMPGLDHARLNQLIDEGPTQQNESKRYAMYHEMEKIIIDEQPYVFRWDNKLHKVAYWKDRLDPTAKPFFKFSGSLTRDPFFMHWRAVKNDGQNTAQSDSANQ